MANRSIFRQAALERLASPEQLDRLMRVTSPRGWMALGGLSLVIGFAFLWSVFGSLSITVAAEGVLVGVEGADVEGAEVPLQAIVAMPAEGMRVRAGMSARVSPVTVRREEYGYVRGEVSSVSPRPATPEEMRRALGDEAPALDLGGTGTFFLVRIDLCPGTDTPSGLLWSSRAGPPARVRSGTPAGVEVVVERRRPIELVIPALRSAPGMS